MLWEINWMESIYGIHMKLHRKFTSLDTTTNSWSDWGTPLRQASSTSLLIYSMGNPQVTQAVPAPTTMLTHTGIDGCGYGYLWCHITSPHHQVTLYIQTYRTIYKVPNSLQSFYFSRIYNIPLESSGIHRNPLESTGIHRNPLKLSEHSSEFRSCSCGIQWNPVELPESPHHSCGFHRIPQDSGNSAGMMWGIKKYCTRQTVNLFDHFLDQWTLI